jgi:hypothetical protein
MRRATADTGISGGLKDLGDGLKQAGDSVRQADDQIQAQADRIQRTAPLPPPSPMPILDTSSDYLPHRQSNIGIPEGPGYGAYVGTVPGGPNVYVIPPGAGP